MKNILIITTIAAVGIGAWCFYKHMQSPKTNVQPAVTATTPAPKLPGITTKPPSKNVVSSNTTTIKQE